MFIYTYLLYKLTRLNNYYFSLSFLITVSYYFFVLCNFSSTLENTDKNSIMDYIIYVIYLPWSHLEGSFMTLICLLVIVSLLIVPLLDNKVLRLHDKIILFILISLIYFTFTGILSTFYSNIDARSSNIANSTFNVILQDLLLIIHPPIIYITYSLAIYMSLLVAQVYMTNRRGTNFLKPLLSTIFYSNSLGLVLGSLWAYMKLGWGGWWFWDPVENLSLIVWLSLLICVHLSSDNEDSNNIGKDTNGIVVYVVPGLIALTVFFFTKMNLLESVHNFALGSEIHFYNLFMITIYLGYSLVLSASRSCVDKKLICKTSVHSLTLFILALFFLLLILIITSTPIYYLICLNFPLVGSVKIDASFYYYFLMGTGSGLLLLYILLANKYDKVLWLALVPFLVGYYSIGLLLVVACIIFKSLYLSTTKYKNKFTNFSHLIILLTTILIVINTHEGGHYNIAFDMGDLIIIKDVIIDTEYIELFSKLNEIWYQLKTKVSVGDNWGSYMYIVKYYITNSMGLSLISFPTILFGYFRDLYLSWSFIEGLRFLSLDIYINYFQSILTILSTLLALIPLLYVRRI